VIRRGVLIGVVVALAAAGGALAFVLADDDGPHAKRPERPNVVILVFDEFPLDTILRPDGRIDAARFPNFARLASTSTWYSNATTIFDSTFQSVPAMLNARYPRKNTPADRRAHPVSMYHLFDRLGYDVVNVESGTALCPPQVCDDARPRRPGVLARLAGNGRPSRLHKWIHSIRDRPRPTLWFQHALLPHEPWIYLPSGRQSRPHGNDPIPGINRPIGFHDPELTEHNEQRHLLQVGFVDREIGRLLDRLEETGTLDETLLVVTADHGYAFELGVPDRRKVNEHNVDEIAPVAMFVKGPGQKRGRVDRRWLRTLDLLPTIATQLHLRIPWRHQGRSAYSRETRERDSVAIPTRDFSRVIRIGDEAMLTRRAANRARRERLFGTGFSSIVAYGSPWASLYRIGPHPELLGRPVAELPVQASAGGVRARVANARLLRAVDPDARILPTRVTGRLAGGDPERERDLAVAVNGRIAAVGRSFHLRGREAEFFSLMVPEEALQRGRNSIQVLEVGGDGSLRRL
jgi:sulfatase-like protein